MAMHAVSLWVWFKLGTGQTLTSVNGMHPDDVQYMLMKQSDLN